MSEGRQLRMIARQVTQVCFDHAVTLRLWQSDGEVTVRVAARFALQYGGTLFDVDPDARENTGAALSLLHTEVIDARATAEGTLLMRFDGGVLLSVAADESYEAWELVDSTGARVVCTPGGELVVTGEPWVS
ncbi:MAG TPA: DUF6188 family protein [Kofleriaceae bacterium]|nr:DUF6188 family protein [Kofleriaceae bacterium]